MLDHTFLKKIIKRKKNETNLKKKFIINKLINKIYIKFMFNNTNNTNYIIFDIINISSLLEILKVCITEQIELHIDTIIEHFPFINSGNIELSNTQNVINFIKCFNAVNKLPNNRFGYKLYNKPIDLNRYQIQCSPNRISGITYVICEVFADKILFESWRLSLDKYL